MSRREDPARAFPIPAPEDFQSEGEVIVWHPADRQPDDLGRLQFIAFWIGYHPVTGHGVRGQVFDTSLAEFIARDEAQGKTVRVVTS